MFGFRRLETLFWDLDRKIGELETEIKKLKAKSNFRAHGSDIVHGGGGFLYYEGADISLKDVVQHLLDKAGIELVYIEGRPAEDTRVGIQKKKVSKKT